ncbi:MAG TPA: winged helix-turn-helix domain-containing protein, partial [Gammaproteobacteria bacterium]|nr:winged helix-turn-helix domain-containing protein [Gammaproteobacteria bacterium]
FHTLTDAHVGALCWHQEGGADWDLKIAERTLGGCFEMMLESAPASRVGIVAQLGDFLHQDSMSAVTPTSGHLLDADGRFSKVVRVAVQTLRRVVDGALRKHKHVLVLMAEGNHDLSSSIWLRVMFKALYEREPRVEVIDSPLPYYAYRHGKTMLGWHHGHLKKNDQLPLLFAAQFPTIWGETVKRYVHTGHRHHVEEREHSGMTVVQHPTLAARDAYAARGGWIAERRASAVVYHVEHGEVGRTTVTPEMLQ